MLLQWIHIMNRQSKLKMTPKNKIFRCWKLRFLPKHNRKHSGTLRDIKVGRNLSYKIKAG